MDTSRARALPPRLLAAQRAFSQWRRRRKVGSRIPDRLWIRAVKLAQAYGMHPTATALGLDYSSLSKRVRSSSKSATGGPPTATRFLELPPPLGLHVPECVLELEDAQGAKMRIHLKGIETPDLASLTRSLWGIQ
jgi:hypothetical protein